MYNKQFYNVKIILKYIFIKKTYNGFIAKLRLLNENTN